MGKCPVSRTQHRISLSDVFSAVVDTTPAGLARSSAERDGSWDGFWEDTKRGSEYIMEEGRTLLVLPTYTNHPRWEWDNKDQENGYPFGMGLARQVIDERGNERMFFLVNFVDSNYRIEPMVGYSWVARYPILNTGWHYGAGYLAGITVRGDYYYLPAPLPLPVAKIGNDWFSFYGTFIPFTNVFFFYSSFTFDDVQSRKMPLPATSPLRLHPHRQRRGTLALARRQRHVLARGLAPLLGPQLGDGPLLPQVDPRGHARGGSGRIRSRHRDACFADPVQHRRL